MSHEVTVIRDADALGEFVPHWRQFVASHPHGSNYFNDPETVNFEVAERGEIPFIAVVRREDRIECLAPFFIRPSQFGLRLSTFKLASFSGRMLKLVGHDFVYADDADMPRCCQQVFEALDFGEFDYAYFEALDARSPVWNYCAATPIGSNRPRFLRPSRALEKSFEVPLPPTFQQYVGLLGSSTRYSRKRSARILLNDHGAKLTRVTAVDQVATFLGAVDEIYRDAWQSKTYGHWKRDSDEEIARFQHAARLGRLRSYLLSNDEGPMAFLIGYRYGDIYHIPAWAFAQRCSDLGPGAVLVYLTIEDLYQDEPPKVIDLGYGEGAIKRSFRGQPFDVGDYYVTPQRFWRRVFAVQRGLSDVETLTRTALVKAGLDNAVRKLLKHKR